MHLQIQAMICANKKETQNSVTQFQSQILQGQLASEHEQASLKIHLSASGLLLVFCPGVQRQMQSAVSTVCLTAKWQVAVSPGSWMDFMIWTLPMLSFSEAQASYYLRTSTTSCISKCLRKHHSVQDILCKVAAPAAQCGSFSWPRVAESVTKQSGLDIRHPSSLAYSLSAEKTLHNTPLEG